jgi:hypothetical protein
MSNNRVLAIYSTIGIMNIINNLTSTKCIAMSLGYYHYNTMYQYNQGKIYIYSTFGIYLEMILSIS